MRINVKKLYVGWIKAKPDNKAVLRFLGVEGEMIYNKEYQCFEYCECSRLVIEVLRMFWKEFWPGCFTAIDKLTEIPLPMEYQICWELD